MGIKYLKNKKGLIVIYTLLFLTIFFILSINDVNSEVTFEPPSIESIQNDIPNATSLLKNKPIKSEVSMDEYNNSFDLYMTIIPPGEDDLWIELEGNDRNNGNIGVIYLYDDFSMGIDFSIDGDSYDSMLVNSKDQSENCTIFIVVYGNGSYTIELSNSPHLSIWFCLIPIMCFFIIFIILIIIIQIVVIKSSIKSTKKRIARRKQAILRKEAIESRNERIDPNIYIKTQKGNARFRKSLFTLMIGCALSGIILMITFLYLPVINIGPNSVFPWFQLGYLFILIAWISMILLWIESITNKQEIPIDRELFKGNIDEIKPFKEILINRIVIIPPLTLLFMFFIYGFMYKNSFPGYEFIMIELIVLSIVLLAIIPVFSHLNVVAYSERIEFFFGPKWLWSRMNFLGKSIPIEDIYWISPVSVHRFRDFLIGTWWVVIGRHGEFGYLTTDRTGVSIITLEGKEYVVSTRNPMRLVNFVRWRKKRNEKQIDDSSIGNDQDG